MNLCWDSPNSQERKVGVKTTEYAYSTRTTNPPSAGPTRAIHKKHGAANPNIQTRNFQYHCTWRNLMSPNSARLLPTLKRSSSRRRQLSSVGPSQLSKLSQKRTKHKSPTPHNVAHQETSVVGPPANHQTNSAIHQPWPRRVGTGTGRSTPPNLPQFGRKPGDGRSGRLNRSHFKPKYIPNIFVVLDFMTPKMKTLNLFETFVTVDKSTKANIPKPLNLQQRRCENRKSRCFGSFCHWYSQVL
jgi:hypothetical protein